MLAAGGAGYFRQAMARPHIESGRLHVVEGTPAFVYPAYAVYAESADVELLQPALVGLRQVVAARASPTVRRRTRGAKR